MVVRQKQVVLNAAKTPAFRARNAKGESLFEVRCPHCRATRDFLTPDGHIMLRVLEDERDTDLLEEGRVLYCEGCGEPFVCPPNPVSAP